MAIIYPNISTGDFASTKTANNFSGSQTITGSLIVSGTVHSTTGGIAFPDSTVQITAFTGSGGGISTLQEAYDNSSDLIPLIALTESKAFWVSGNAPSYLELYSIDITTGEVLTLNNNGTSDLQINSNNAGMQSYVNGNYIVDVDGNIELKTLVNTSDDNKITLRGSNIGTGTPQIEIYARDGSSQIGITNSDGWDAYLKCDSATNTVDLQAQENNAILNIGTLYAGAGQQTINIGNDTSTTVISGTLNISGTVNTVIANTWNKPQVGAITTYNNVSGSTTVDLGASNNFKLLLSGNLILENPSNITEGQSGIITIVQPAGIYYTMSYGTFWKFASGSTNILTANSGAIDILSYYVVTSSYAVCNLVRDFS